MGAIDFIKKIPTLFGYDAAERNGRRRARIVDLRREDKTLPRQYRDRVVSDARDLRRNYSIAAWAIRTHLDYCSTFHFQSRTGIAGLDDQIEKLMANYSQPANCDVMGRFSLQGLIRLMEGGRTVDGDCFLQKIVDGRLQVIEGDRIRTATVLGDFENQSIDLKSYIHGIQIDPYGKPLNLSVCDRDDLTGGFKLQKIIPASQIYQHGYFDRYDQVRGVSPLASAINTFCDLYEAQEYALAKMKLAQLFGLKFKRATDTSTDDNVDSNGNPQPYKFNFGGGPQVLDLEPGDDAEFIEANTPSTEFQSFMVTAIQIALKSLDIPFSFYSEDFTNYSGARQALLQYQQSVSLKRQSVQQMLNDITRWRLALWVADGDLYLPNTKDGKGLTVEDIEFEWIGAGIPWIDPVKEATGDILQIGAGLSSRETICREAGKDFYKIIDQLAAENKYAASKGVSLNADIKGDSSQIVEGKNGKQQTKSAA